MSPSIPFYPGEEGQRGADGSPGAQGARGDAGFKGEKGETVNKFNVNSEFILTCKLSITVWASYFRMPCEVL